MNGDFSLDAEIALGEQVRCQLVQTKITCPFLGSVVAEGILAVRNNVNNPLARIEDVRKLGNTGGGDLGDLLVMFAVGNHSFIRGVSGKLDVEVPIGLFSLELPGSQGSHFGHSGILQGDPELPDSGRLNQANFERFESRSKNGIIKRSDVGRFIAENLLRDPKSKVLGEHVGALLARDLFEFVEVIGPALIKKISGSDEDAALAYRTLKQKLTKLLGEDNLVGSAGEFGLLFALLSNKPGDWEVEGEPGVSLQDLKAMFVEKRLPDGWEKWKKTRVDWIKHTTALLINARKEYQALKKRSD